MIYLLDQFIIKIVFCVEKLLMTTCDFDTMTLVLVCEMASNCKCEAKQN